MENKTVSLTEQIYAELVDGLKTDMDWTQFLAQHGASKGPLYNAIGRFFNDMEPKARALGEVQVSLDQAGFRLDQLDREIKEAEGKIAPLEERRNVLNEETETLEAKLAEKNELLKHAGELEKHGFDTERLGQLKDTLADIGAKHGLKGKEAVAKFFDELKDYDAKTGFQGEIQRLEIITGTKRLEAEKWQAEEEALKRKHDDLKEAIGAVYALRAKGVKVSQIPIWQHIFNRFETVEQFDEYIAQYGDATKLLNARKQETESYELRLAQVQSQLETLEKKRIKIEASIDALKVAGVKELKAMTEATEKQLKAMVATQIRETRVVGQGVGKELDNLLATQIKETRAVGQVVKKELDNLFAQLDALGEKAIGVGRAVGTIEEQLRRNGKARDVLNLLENPMAAAYEDYTPLVLLLAMSMRIWVSNNKDKFTLSYRVDEGLEALIKNLGGS